MTSSGSARLRERPGVLLAVLVYMSLSTAIISSLGILLIPTLATDHHVSLSAAQWILTVNLLVGAVSTPVLGRLGDGAHTRRVLQLTLGCIGVGSLLAATATTFTQLLIGRALQGVAYGVIPVAMALVRVQLPAERVRPTVAILAVTSASGIGLGYPLTGAIAQYAHYRLAFYLAMAFSVTAVIAISLVIPRPPARTVSRPARFDVAGALLLTAASATGLLALSESERWGWSSPAIVGLLAAAAVCAVVWVWWELRVPSPLIRLQLFRHADVRLAQGAALGLGISMYAAFTAVAQIAQAPAETGYGVGLSVVMAGLVIMPLSVASQFASRIAVAVGRRWGQHVLLPVAAVVVALTDLALIWHHGETWQLLVAMALLGVGLGCGWSAMASLILSAVPANEVGSTSGLNAVLRTFGGAVASAAIAALLTATAADGVTTDAGYQRAFAMSALVATALAAWVGLRAWAAHGRLRAGAGAADLAEISGAG
ncbi:MAG: MFS transporter [Sporichthyaceae bacterium]